MKSMTQPEYILPDWPAPANVHAYTTTRVGGVSLPPWDRFNLADHVGDDPEHVASNRARLRETLSLPGEPVWLRQVHGRNVRQAVDGPGEADASYADRPGVVCAVLTADCLPVLLCDREGGAVAAVHAGWRGLVAGVVEAAVACFAAGPDSLLVWLGPAIGPAAFEVGPEVRNRFLQADEGASGAFVEGEGDRWYADLYVLARRRLARAGVQAVYGGGHCTFTEQERFYSFRRDGETGRMASLIWIDETGSN
ncbi:MAG: peptidoglycan editing factor PgeF [Acidiferrobacteraceae bacterium]|jgi:YfiH family protein